MGENKLISDLKKISKSTWRWIIFRRWIIFSTLQFILIAILFTKLDNLRRHVKWKFSWQREQLDSERKHDHYEYITSLEVLEMISQDNADNVGFYAFDEHYHSETEIIHTHDDYSYTYHNHEYAERHHSHKDWLGKPDHNHNFDYADKNHYHY